MLRNAPLCSRHETQLRRLEKLINPPSQREGPGLTRTESGGGPPSRERRRRRGGDTSSWHGRARGAPEGENYKRQHGHSGYLRFLRRWRAAGNRVQREDTAGFTHPGEMGLRLDPTRGERRPQDEQSQESGQDQQTAQEEARLQPHRHHPSVPRSKVRGVLIGCSLHPH